MKRLAVRRTANLAHSAGQLDSSVLRAITFLYQSQQAHGEFQTIAAANESLTAQAQPDSSLFVTALVLYALGWSDDPRVPRMLERGLDFFAVEMKGAGVWSYWSKQNPHANSLPPDLDDTCCISFLIKKYARPLPSNKPLVLANCDARGLYYTWIAARPNLPGKRISNQVRGQLRAIAQPAAGLVLSLSGTLNNIDCAVNANVLLYLGQMAETQPAIEYLIETALQDRVQERTTFYLHPFSFYYMLARAYANRVTALERTRATIVARLAAAQSENGSFGSELLTALAACTLSSFGESGPVLDRAVGALLATQRADGSWMRHAMFLGPAPYYGSEALTTALAVEALSRYRALLHLNGKG